MTDETETETETQRLAASFRARLSNVLAQHPDNLFTAEDIAGLIGTKIPDAIPDLKDALQRLAQTDFRSPKFTHLGHPPNGIQFLLHRRAPDAGCPATCNLPPLAGIYGLRRTGGDR